MPRATGPKTPLGKVASSKNAIKHGLTAKNWLDESEQAFYTKALRDLNRDHEPASRLEEMQVERIASCMTRLERIHKIEDSMFKLAKLRADDPQIYLDGMGFNKSHSRMISKFAELLNNSYSPPTEVVNYGIQAELLLNNIKIETWQEFQDSLPTVWWHVVTECVRRNCDVTKYIREYGRSVSRLPSPVTRENDVRFSEENIDKVSTTGKNLTESELTRFIEAITTEVMIHRGLEGMKLEYENQRDVIINAALPVEKEMARINRERTSNERLLSRSIGELLEMQRQ